MVRVSAESAEGDLDASLARASYGRNLARELLGKPKTMVPYSAPLLDAVSLFEQLVIGYALAGGVAAMYYGRPRFTEDIDFVAASGHQEKLARAGEAMRRWHFDPACTWKLYHESGIDIDIWKDEFADDLVARAVHVPMANRSIRIVEMHDLIAMKLRAGRLQDDYDIAEIIKHQRIDEDTIEARVSPSLLERFREIQARANRELRRD